jgi:hypothetical protein
VQEAGSGARGRCFRLLHRHRLLLFAGSNLAAGDAELITLGSTFSPYINGVTHNAVFIVAVIVALES